MKRTLRTNARNLRRVVTPDDTSSTCPPDRLAQDPKRADRTGRSRFGRPRTLRSLVVATTGVAAVVAVSSTAWASPPEQGSFSSHDLFVDSEVCAPEGFPVNVVEDFSGDYQINVDNTGAVQLVVVHIDGRWVISANGITLVERDKWTEFYYPDGTKRMVGNSVHITGPGPGLVQHDAGQLIFNPDGTVTIHGPHPQFEGQTWCFALLP